jgi:adenylate cyclase
LKVKSPSERSIRLASGLFMFSFAACHFLSHATGLLLLDNMELIGRHVLLAPWRNTPMRAALLICFVVHSGVGLRAFYRRRHLRMPAIEAVQLGLGLVIPVLLIPHAFDVRLGYSFYRFEDSYYRVVYKYWLTQPLTGLPRQFALLLAIWTHGCIGIHMWLRFRPGYVRWRGLLLIVATLIPILAVMGVNNAGWDAALRARTEADFRSLHGPPPAGSERAIEGAALANFLQGLQIAWVVLVAAVALARAIRNRRARKGQGVTISYSGGPTVKVPRGYSILEASRSISLPHESVCGGRARCSTCRVRIQRGFEDLPSPSDIESATLSRVGAPASVRLACQVRPEFDVAVSVLLASPRPPRGRSLNLMESRELTVTAMFVDLRNSTGLASGRLPFDVIFVVDRYVQAVTVAVRAHAGAVTSVAGDGVMSVFGLDGDAAAGARNALAAAEELWRLVEKLGADLADELGGPLKFGIGVHTGLSVVGTVGLLGHTSIQFLGDTGNLASRLEGLTKETRCTMIVSATTVAASEISIPGWRRADLEIRGRGEPLSAFLIFDCGELASAASSLDRAAQTPMRSTRR